MSTPSKEEMWADFIKRVMPSIEDKHAAAKRLHTAHIVIFGERMAPLYINDHQSSDVSARSKRAIWATCLKCAEQSSDHVDDVANRLIKAHKIIFGGNDDHQ